MFVPLTVEKRTKSSLLHNVGEHLEAASPDVSLSLNVVVLFSILFFFLCFYLFSFLSFFLFLFRE